MRSIRNFRLLTLVVAITTAMSSIVATSSQATDARTGNYRIDSGDKFICYIDSSEAIQCWGQNTSGQLGRGTTSTSEVLGLVSGITDAKAIAAGAEFACAIVGTGAVKCWGANTYGQLGNASTTASSTPVEVAGIWNAVQIVAGARHACALLATSVVKCWGSGSNGKLGNGATTDSSTPVTVSTAQVFESIYAGWYITCGLTITDDSFCWGRGNYGALGNGTITPTDISTPVADAALTGIANISFAESSTCWVKTDGSIACRGNSYYGEMGNGQVTSFNHVSPQFPQYISTTLLSGVTQVASTNSSHCALLSDKTVACWGNRDSLQVGLPTSNTYAEAFSGLANVEYLFGGWQHYCAVLSDNSLTCWGNNSAGQLATGNTTNSSSPISIYGVSVTRSAGINSPTASPSPSPSVSVSASPTPSFSNTPNPSSSPIPSPSGSSSASASPSASASSSASAGSGSAQRLKLTTLTFKSKASKLSTPNMRKLKLKLSTLRSAQTIELQLVSKAKSKKARDMLKAKKLNQARAKVIKAWLKKRGVNSRVRVVSYVKPPKTKKGINVVTVWKVN